MKLPEAKYAVTADKNHNYQITMPDGSTVGPLKSVTKIVGIIEKPALIGWAAREAANYFRSEILRLGGTITPEMIDQIAKDAAMAHRRKSKDAADLGTKCHDIFDAIIKGIEPDAIPLELVEPSGEFKKYRMQSDIEVVTTELAVASLAHKFGGRLDFLGYSKKRGGWGIGDYKTSSGFYGSEYAFQVGGYAVAVEEMYGIKISWAEIIRFSNKPPFESEARPVTDMAAAMSSFLVEKDMSNANELKLIGDPTFSSAGVPEEKPAKKKAHALGF
jgi:hypothetical protein